MVQCLVADESSLYDFIGVDDMELVDIRKRIGDMYALDVADLES